MRQESLLKAEILFSILICNYFTCIHLLMKVTGNRLITSTSLENLSPVPSASLEIKYVTQFAI